MRTITRPIDAWPIGSPRRQDYERQQSRFSASWTETMDLLKSEAEHLGADEIVMQIDIRESDIRADGEPRANARQPADPGVIISFESDKGPLNFASDAFRGSDWGGYLPGWKANVRAVALGLSDLRRVDRYGITPNSEQYRGFNALEAGDGPTSKEASALLLLEEADCGEPNGVERVITEPEFRAKVYRKAAMRTHPDQNGEEWTDRFRDVQMALEVLSR